MMLAKGHVLHNRYHILEVLGQGGMATVYKAHDAILNCSCAVKEMIPDPTASPQALTAALDQFRREAQVLATLRHPGLPRVIDHFHERGHAYLVMDFIDGESLAERLGRLKGKPLPERLVLAWAQQLLEALEHCHRHNVIHRDIKPHNVIVTPTGRVVLVDFGLVKLYDPIQPGTATVVRGMGTPEYTPPEQYDAPGSGHTDVRSDIYALGATLYHLMTGEAPPTATQRMADPHSFRRPRQLNANVSPQMESVILKAMEIPRDRRFWSAAEMWAALAGWTKMPQVPPQQVIPLRKAGFPAWAWTLGGLAIVALVVAVMLATGTEVAPSPTPHLTRAPTMTATVTPTALPAPEQTAEKIRQEVATVQAELSEEGISLLSDSQAAEMLNGLFQHASESGVEIANLQTKPGPEGGEKGIYDIRPFRLQAEGAVYRLVDFASRIRGGIAVEYMTITKNILTMEITIYTSSHVSEDVSPTTYGDASQVAEALTSVNSYDPSDLALVDLRYDNRRFSLKLEAIDGSVVAGYARTLRASQLFSRVEVQSMTSIAESGSDMAVEAVIVLDLS